MSANELESGSVLFSEGRSDEIPAEHDVYGWLVGGWHIDVIEYPDSGDVRRGTGEVHFAWALEGRAIQDVWIMPPRGARPRPRAAIGNRYGTTIRVYDPAHRVWRITWINPVTGKHNRLTGLQRDGEIVQNGVDDDGSLMRWRFIDIRPDAFRWLGESSVDGGASWRLAVEFLARRTSEAPLR